MYPTSTSARPSPLKSATAFAVPALAPTYPSGDVQSVKVVVEKATAPGGAVRLRRTRTAQPVMAVGSGVGSTETRSGSPSPSQSTAVNSPLAGTPVLTEEK